MAQLVVTMFTSLDGIAQAPGGRDEDRDGGFELGGWFFPSFGEDMGPVISSYFARADAFLLGRRTYEIFAGYWPKVTDPNDVVATKLNTLPKFVASRTLGRADWRGATVMKGDVAEVVKRLKATLDGELQVHGSPNLVQTLVRNDLVDEYRIWTAPVLLGRGKRLFEAGTAPIGLELVEAKSSSTGVQMNRYSRKGPVVCGDFEPPTQ